MESGTGRKLNDASRVGDGASYISAIASHIARIRSV